MKIKKSQLKELIKQSLYELSGAEKAKKMGLKSKGFGNWVDPKSGQHYPSKGGKLHKVDSKDTKKKEKPSLGTSIANKFQKQKDKYDKARKEKPPESTKISAKGMDNPYADKEKKKHISKKDKGTLGKLAKMMGKEKDSDTFSIKKPPRTLLILLYALNQSLC